MSPIAAGPMDGESIAALLQSTLSSVEGLCAAAACRYREASAAPGGAYLSGLLARYGSPACSVTNGRA